MLETISSFPEKDISGILNQKMPMKPRRVCHCSTLLPGVTTLLQGLNWICRVSEPRLHLPVYSFYTCSFKHLDDRVEYISKEVRYLSHEKVECDFFYSV